ncbi:MAG TPA: 50S ribosomal protein L11 methyltransferase [Myxococcales bacterium]|nr:50S ribosomal protein L11 methyltransferase [Myxococcales bacterium]
MSWALVLIGPPDELEVVSAELFEMGALGVELQEPGMPLMPGTLPLPEGRARAIAHFGDRAAAAGAASALGVEPPVEVPEEDWSTAWRAHHRTMRVGPRSWVVPPWQEKPREGVSVVIDPGMAFGTGSHPTTSLCLERCDELLGEMPGADVLDVGTGSGVIALLAKKLGAGRVVGTENDPVALQAARDGETLNQLSRGAPFGPTRHEAGIDWVLTGDPVSVPGRFGIVVANIRLNTLEELAAAIASKVAPGGVLVLSGLLASQGDEAAQAYVRQGLRETARKERDGWIRVELRR